MTGGRFRVILVALDRSQVSDPMTGTVLPADFLCPQSYPQAFPGAWGQVDITAFGDGMRPDGHPPLPALRQRFTSLARRLPVTPISLINSLERAFPTRMTASRRFKRR